MSVNWTYWPSDPLWSQDYYDYRAPWIRPARPGVMPWALRRTVDPASEPVSLDLAKRHLRVDYNDDDDLINSVLIPAAREYTELRTSTALISSTWQQVLDRWPRQNAVEFWPQSTFPPGSIILQRYPLTTVNSVSWTAADGTVSTVAGSDYIVDFGSRPPRLIPAYGKFWPQTSLAPAAGVSIAFQAGYADAAHVPPTLKQILLLVLGHWYENRTAVVIDNRIAGLEVPQAVDTLVAMWQPPQVG